MADYAEYLRTTGLPKKQQQLAKGSQIIEDMLQQIKNKSAPVVSGGGGSVASSTTNLGKLPTMGSKVNPVTGARISQEWGKSNIKYAAGRHTGMDFAAAHGTKVGAAAAGVVKRTGTDKSYGNYIAVGHADGSTSFYAHLAGVNVRAGAKVSTGQKIGTVGNTGRSTGAHLHFEIRKTDKYGGDINPRNWFSTR